MNRNEMAQELLSIRERAMDSGLMIRPEDTSKLADIAYQIMDEAGKKQFERDAVAMVESMADSAHDIKKPGLRINGAWYINQLPEHIVIELPDGRLTMVRVSPFRQLTAEDFGQYRGYHPRKCKGQPLPEYLYRFYGLTRSDETANEVIHVRLTPSEKAAVQAAADGAGKTISEFVRDWIRTL